MPQESRNTPPPRDQDERVTVATYFARPLSRVLAAGGLDPERVLGPFGLAEVGPERRVRFDDAAAAWRAAADATGDPAIGVRAAQELVPGDYGVLEYAARASATLRGAFERLGRYHRLLNDRSEVVLDGDGTKVRVRYLRPGAQATMPAPYVEYVLASWVCTARALTARPLVLDAVRFPHAAPANTAPHVDVFGASVSFGTRVAELHLPAAAMDQPLPLGDVRLLGVLDRHAEILLDELSRSTQWSSRVIAEVERLLADGAPRLESVAVRLGTPSRALRRRLEEEGTTFARLVDDVRRRLAVSMVSDRSLSLGEIAFLLGFSEASAFHRAFRRWTGGTPRP